MSLLIFEADNSIRSKVMRGPKISKLGQLLQDTPTQGSFYGPDAVGVHRLCAKFEADIIYLFKSL